MSPPLTEHHEQVTLKLSKRTLASLDRHIYQKYGSPGVEGRYRDIEIILAIRALLDRDRVADLETAIDALDETLADGCDGYLEITTTSGSGSGSGSSDDVMLADDERLNRADTQLIQPYIPDGLHEDLKAFAKRINAERSTADSTIYMVDLVELAISEHVDGGRVARLIDRIEDMRDRIDAAGTDAEDAADAEGDEDDEKKNPHTIEEKKVAIREHVLGKVSEPSFDELDDEAEIPKVWFEEAIDKYCTRGGRETATDVTHTKYLDGDGDVTGLKDDLGLVEVEGGTQLRFASSVNDDLGEHTPAFERKDHATLGRSERVEAVRVTLIRKAANRTDRNAGQYQASAAELREWFDCPLTDQQAHELRRLATEPDGFRAGTAADGTTKVVKVDLGDVTDTDLLRAAGLDARADRLEIEHEAKSEMDRITNANPAD